MAYADIKHVTGQLPMGCCVWVELHQEWLACTVLKLTMALI